jgi:hypothetical protein
MSPSAKSPAANSRSTAITIYYEAMLELAVASVAALDVQTKRGRNRLGLTVAAGLFFVQHCVVKTTGAHKLILILQ